LSVRVSALTASDLIATLRLLGPDQQSFWTLGPGGRADQQWPLVGGRGSVEGVPAGTWTLQIEAPDGQRWSSTAVSSGNGETVVTVQ
jgi:hypothetical protein